MRQNRGLYIGLAFLSISFLSMTSLLADKNSNEESERLIPTAREDQATMSDDYRARMGPRVTDTRNDVELSANIRRDITEDSFLSMSAKNINIAVNNGHVTLRGQVRNEQEFRTVMQAAKKHAGSNNVTNELKIEVEN